MTAGLSVKAFEVKSHDTPDELRTPSKTKVEEPGWRWSECIKPVVGTASCQVPHVGYAVSGRLTVRMDDGTQKTLAPGSSYTIPPGHDAWVEGRSLSSASRS